MALERTPVAEASYAVAIERLYALAAELHTPAGAVRRKFRLEDMRMLLAALGDPQLRFPSVLIAGTNGKGSTAATLASILTSAGYRTGLYTSPHLARANERIQVGGQPIGDEDFAALFFKVEAAADGLVRDGTLSGMPSFFETMTAMAFLHFASDGGELRAKTGGGGGPVDLAVLEVGLGGRLDATNVVEPLLSILTDISLDHTEWLGPTIDAIAREKAGILRPGGTMITLPQHPEANQAIGEVAVALGVRGVNAAVYLPSHDHPERYVRNRYALGVLGEMIEVDSPLAGQHQQRNIALAIAAAVELRGQGIRNSDSYNIAAPDTWNNAGAEVRGTGNQGRGFDISARDIEHGIRNTVWPGRLEHILAGPSDQPRAEVLLDVAHNPAGAWALRAALSNLEESELEPTSLARADLASNVTGARNNIENRPRSLTLVFGCLNDKAIGEIAQILFPLFDKIVVTPVDSPRTASVGELIAAAGPTGSEVSSAPDAGLALDVALRSTPLNGLIVATGSVHLVGDIRRLLLSGAADGFAPVKEGFSAKADGSEASLQQPGASPNPGRQR